MDELLHVLRIKGRATLPELAVALGRDAAALEPALEALRADGLALRQTAGRRPGWMLTPEGRDAHALATRTAIDDEQRGRLVEGYREFLKVNDRTKGLCATWQTTGDAARRHDVLAELAEVQREVAPALAQAGGAVPRFGRYGQRLATALEQADADARFVASPLVDSFHTIWFECHEDFLVTLGRDRHQDDSW